MANTTQAVEVAVRTFPQVKQRTGMIIFQRGSDSVYFLSHVLDSLGAQSARPGSVNGFRELQRAAMLTQGCSKNRNA